MKTSSRKRTLHSLLVLVLAGMAFSLALYFKPVSEPLLGDIHHHADFKVYINNEAIDFAQEEYMSEIGGNSFNPFTHLHDMNGEVIHKHMTGLTLGDFFTSLGMSFSETCFEMDYKTKNCNNETSSLKFYVNGSLNTKFDQYELNDLDQILISYGNESAEQIQAQLDSVTDEACIYSETCPERGNPPDESSCLGAEECLAPKINTELK